MDHHKQRLDRVRLALKKAEVDALLVTDFTNVTYLTGFTGDDSYLLVRRQGEVLLSDPRYTTQLEEECPGLELHIRRPGVPMWQAVVKVLRQSKVVRLGVESDSMTVGLQEKILQRVKNLQIALLNGTVEELRQIKDKHEIAAIRRAAWEAEKAFAAIRATLRPDKTEKQIADELEYQMRVFGARRAAFPSIVGVGPRAALPHATPGQNRIAESDFVLIDWGAYSGLYNSDLTRVLVTGRITPKFERVYRVVLRAQTSAIAAIRPGVTCHDVDAVARKIIADAGYNKYFGHGLGHGLGMAVHESPRLAVKSTAVLRPGMVVTVEPGIYLPGWGGVRLEDDVLVTRNGHEVLTSVPKQLEDVVVQ